MMISVSQADKIIAKNMPNYGTELVSLAEAYGRVLREKIVADRDLPPFNKSLMDGIAIKRSAWEKGTRQFRIEATQAAGQSALTLKSEKSCVEIMTGAVIPRGCDSVIPVEHIQTKKDTVHLADDLMIDHMQNIRSQGADHKRKEVLLQEGTVLLAPQIAVAASVGKSKIKVSVKPKVAIISTGDEIVEIDAPNIQPFQIRKSNSYFLKAALDNTHLLESKMFHFPDNKDVLLKEIGQIIKKFDVLVLTGGVSMGKFDFVPEVLQELGVKVLFHKVKQKPGKPFWFGKGRKGQPVFALPGNPVSTEVGALRYVIPYLKCAVGIRQSERERAVLTEDFIPDTKFTLFLTVKICFNHKGQIEAKPVVTGGSGDLATVAHSDGFLELPPEQSVIKKGFVGKFFQWA